MILADTSIWVAHLRLADPTLGMRLRAREILSHPFVIGELAMGNLGQRAAKLQLLDELPKAVVASHDEVMTLIEQHGLHGLGVGYIDMHLLASTRLTPGARLWTRDQRLHAVGAQMGVSV